MSNKRYTSRYIQIVWVIVILMVILAVRLFVLAVGQEDRWESVASEQSIKSIYTSAPRGNIYDKYGRTIATNKQIFTVTFNSSGLETEVINDSAYHLINKLIANGDKYTDNFPIKIRSNGTFYYTYKEEIKKWLKKQDMPLDTTAWDAFQKLRAKYGIDPKLDRFEALEELQLSYGVYPPISVKYGVYSYDQELTTFLGNFGFTTEEIKAGISAEEAFRTLRKDFSIDPSLSDREARKIFIVRNEVQKYNFSRYIPLTIATDVSEKTIAYFEEKNIPGIEIASDVKRYYPNGRTASHILGYMGSISDTESDYYVNELGYNADTLIGKDGIEKSYEEYLKGTDGVKQIQVNSSGEYISTVSEEEPIKGKDVYLTIDLNLQKVAEDALEKVVKAVKTGGVYRGEYGTVGLGQYSNCESGAVVAIEVETGDVLAMASYPDYNPNIFAEGISNDDWESVQSKNPRDLLAPTPLYNVAAKSAVQPGSTFKPITAVAALECGLNPNLSIYDKGYVKVGDRTYGCSSWNDYGGSHGNETLEYGIGNSCNYYFFCIGTGKDYGTGRSLNYKHKISVDKIMSVAKEFGLGEETGIEIDEETTPLASAERKMEQMRISLWNYIYSNAAKYFPQKIYDNYEALEKNIDTITDWIYDNPSREQIMKLMEEKTDVKKSKIETVTDICKFSYFNMAEWNLGDEFNISIGQGDNSYTPLQMCNYVATLGNNGVKNQVSLIKGIEGQGLNTKASGKDIDLPNKDLLKDVIKGMKKVASGGTLVGIFSNFKYEVAAKTGTAEKAGYINPKDEVKYVKKHLSQITSSVSWKQVEKKMTQLMKENPDIYTSENGTVDQALIQASKGKVTYEMINRYKDTYDNFAWTIAMAPANNPKIAVVVMLVQGGMSYNAAPVAREVIGTYLDSQYSKNTGSVTTSNVEQ